MIPSLLAQDVAKSLREFIVTGFETDTWPFAGKFEQLVNSHNDGEAFIKGPYVSISLPFAKNTDRKDFFSGFETEYSPFVHQQQAWSNLRSNGKPHSTIVATGTGSGKTECFLYPLLDHCQRNVKPGIKAIVIYPMNALAGDQAKRFADVIHSTPELKGKVRVGLFVGGESDEKFMGEKQVITCKNTLRKSPPDILLTNYKMLDFLLMRPKDQVLWQHNMPDKLKYLIVDELHTFDGAQGSDLAMLIRRLKARLGVKTEDLICAGTSATLGSEAQMDDLAKYAANIFDTHFDRNSFIGESREGHDQFLGMIEYMLLDPSFTPEQLKPDFYASLDDYLTAQSRLFFGAEWTLAPQGIKSRQELGKRLRKHPLMHNLLYMARRGPVAINKLLPAIQKQVPPQLKNNVTDVLVSLLALLSHARGVRYPGEPFVTVRMHLWARELRRIVARVGTDTQKNPVHLQFSDDLKSRAENEKHGDIYLPTVQCNECHMTAWLTTIELGENYIEQDLRKIYTRFFANDKQIRVLLPLKTPEQKPPAKGLVKHLCTVCGHLQQSSGKCLSCNEQELVTIYEPDLNKSIRRGGIPSFESQRMCPVCQANSSLILFGARAASLSSVAIQQMFANKINDDKKLIAFSNSVQDAAHRAGFFAARTWQNNVRMALAKAVTHYCNSNNQAISFTELFDYLPHFWLGETENKERLSVLNYITQFIPPNMQTHEDYLSLKENCKLENPGHLISLINKRMIWESLSEFGIRSLIGRSLERTGVATVYWSPELIDVGAQILVECCREGLGYSLTDQNAKFLLWGIALRMKRQGAIYDELLRTFIEEGGKYFVLNRLHFLPKFGDFSTVPRFPAEVTEHKFDCVYTKKQSTWYSRWALQLLDDGQLVDDNFVSDLLKLVMHSLVKSGLLLQIETRKENKAWALNPDKLYITNVLGAVRLRRGSSVGATQTSNDLTGSDVYGSWYLPQEWIDHISGMPSLDQMFLKDQAVAVYESNAHPRLSMYHDFYVHGEIKRVIGHEHTALLERKYREDLEQRFMAEPKDRQDWYENLLSATPTLEMGIDIGDLSSVLLCSVPPSQANYLQRAGRGGRKDGNSFVLTLANGHPHDLYFYADPLKLLAGDVQAPAIFLNARMVLRRQLLAFCFDHWGVSLNGQQVIPSSMQTVLDAVENGNQKRFPYSLLDFIGKHRDELWDNFNRLLDDDVLPETRDKLKAYLLGTSEEEDALNVYVLNRIKQVVDERKNFIRHQKELESELRSLKRKPKDEARDQLEQELNTELEGIKRLKTDLNRKDTLNFLTDDGLLPNYAFPEEGTTLRSVIFRRLSKPIELEDGKTTSYDYKVFEYARPAHAALSELAPESVFYASNRKVKIERIEMARGENLEYWRLCPSCSYSERIIGADRDAACPRCNNPMWANVSQLMPMVRLRQVYANTKEDDAFIGDDSDTREPTFYNKQMLIDFDSADILHAYAMKTDTRPFGFEFIKKVLFKEINFGKQGGSDQLLNVAGVELARPGFRLCKECGMVQHRRNQAEHMFKCSHKKTQSQSEGDVQSAAGIIDCLYLYRQYESEAVRILMPKLSLVERETQIQSFVAALQLGLKSCFGGKVDHLNITVSDEPIPGSLERASYLVLYDTVPGGTGYLHTLLADPANLMKTLELSRQIMAACECQHSSDMDGCYNCLYAYKNSYGMENTSRAMALGMLNDILDENVELVAVDHLGKINKNVWADSELESRFPEALQALNQSGLLGGARVRTTKDIVNGKVGFKLEIGDLIYSVEPHARLGREDGIAYPCEPDFLISLDRESDEQVKVAVFLDGYSHHKDIVHEDLMKRQGISLGTSMLTWSLTWHDVNHVFAGSEVKIPNALRDNTGNAPVDFINKISETKGLKAHSQIAELSPIVMLLKFLTKPEIDKWRSYAMLRALSWLDQTKMKSPEERADLDQQLDIWPSQFVDSFSGKDLIFCSSNKLKEEPVDLAMYVAGEQAAIKELDPESMILAAIFNPKNTDDELTKITWQKLLQILNIGQFLPKFFVGTQQGIENGDFAQLEWRKQSKSIENDEWDRIVTLADENISDVVNILALSEVPTPEVGYELVNEKGAGIGAAELAWENVKIAIMLDYQLEESRDEFEKRGWQVVTINDDMDALISKLRGQE